MSDFGVVNEFFFFLNILFYYIFLLHSRWRQYNFLDVVRCKTPTKKIQSNTEGETQKRHRGYKADASVYNVFSAQS